MRDHLCEGGTYLTTLRLPLEGRKARPLEETCDAFAASFAHVWLIPEAAEEPTKPGNNTLIASDADLVATGCERLVGFEWRGGAR